MQLSLSLHFWQLTSRHLMQEELTSAYSSGQEQSLVRINESVHLSHIPGSNDEHLAQLGITQMYSKLP
jgi:hypothetical protein